MCTKMYENPMPFVIKIKSISVTLLHLVKKSSQSDIKFAKQNNMNINNYWYQRNCVKISLSWLSRTGSQYACHWIPSLLKTAWTSETRIFLKFSLSFATKTIELDQLMTIFSLTFPIYKYWVTYRYISWGPCVTTSSIALS